MCGHPLHFRPGILCLDGHHRSGYGNGLARETLDVHEQPGGGQKDQQAHGKEKQQKNI
ncbi:hypothetical protein [Stenotrophomonas maltophilia]|uniref:hypothetical protein n=1 Tax=Stenotrophomonas maltophilia TaxID=40324 RepID=UPI003D18BF58